MCTYRLTRLRTPRSPGQARSNCGPIAPSGCEKRTPSPAPGCYLERDWRVHCRFEYVLRAPGSIAKKVERREYLLPGTSGGAEYKVHDQAPAHDPNGPQCLLRPGCPLVLQPAQDHRKPVNQKDAHEKGGQRNSHQRYRLENLADKSVAVKPAVHPHEYPDDQCKEA